MPSCLTSPRRAALRLVGEQRVVVGDAHRLVERGS